MTTGTQSNEPRKGGMPRGPRPIKVCPTCGSEYKRQCAECAYQRRKQWDDDARARKKLLREALQSAWDLTQRLGESLLADAVIATGLRNELRTMDCQLALLRTEELFTGESASADLDGSQQARIDRDASDLLADLDL